MKNIITCALPYVNGNLHIGHFFEAVCADIKAKYLNKTQTPCYFISGDDCHGAATTLYCQKHNLNIQNHLEQQYLLHKKSYADLKVDFSLFSKTNTALHQQVVQWCVENILAYEKKHQVKLFEVKQVQSWFDSSSGQFLPDRYVKGTCPHCHALGQHPEICESCNIIILPETLLNPVSVLTNEFVSLKSSAHLTLNTQGFYNEIVKHQDLFHDSIKNKILDSSVCKQPYIDISRDGPYYGIKIKGFEELKNQFFYVWFDAPIGYLTFAYECWLNGRVHTQDHFNLFLSDCELEHFIGKDIAYFHTYLWINLLKLIHPQIKIKKINFHGWITLDKVKFSKSKGHQFDLSQFSSQQIDALRLYFFSKHDGSIQDVEFAENEVYDFYNQTVVKGLANFYARSIRISQKHNLSLSYSTSLNHNYSDYIKEGSYKKLYLLLNADLKQLNSEFQSLEIWNETDSEKVQLVLNEFLQRWFDIYQILCLVCPDLNNVREDILNNHFIHIAKPLDAFSLFNSFA